MIGNEGKCALGTSVERKTRKRMLLHLPHGRIAAQMRDALQARITELPDRNSQVVADVGPGQVDEPARLLQVDTGVQV